MTVKNLLCPHCGEPIDRFNGDMLQLALDIRMKSIAQFSRDSGIGFNRMQRFVAGLADPSTYELNIMAALLHFPIAHFYRLERIDTRGIIHCVPRYDR